MKLITTKIDWQFLPIVLMWSLRTCRIRALTNPVTRIVNVNETTKSAIILVLAFWIGMLSFSACTTIGATSVIISNAENTISRRGYFWIVENTKIPTEIR